jgi:hypothetical protein
MKARGFTGPVFEVTASCARRRIAHEHPRYLSKNDLPTITEPPPKLGTRTALN